MNGICRILITLVTVFVGFGVWAVEPDSNGNHPALVIVDIQEFYFEGGAIPLVGSVEAAKSANRVLERFRGREWPVIHVQHLPQDTDTPGQEVVQAYRIRPEVAPAVGEGIVGKHHANSFRDTDLLEKLRTLGVDDLVVIGMQTHMCLEAATRAAADFGYHVTVVSDACATRDLEFDGKTVPAAQVQASTLASLDGTYARIVSLDNFLEETK